MIWHTIVYKLDTKEGKVKKETNLVWAGHPPNLLYQTKKVQFFTKENK